MLGQVWKSVYPPYIFCLGISRQLGECELSAMIFISFHLAPHWTAGDSPGQTKRKKTLLSIFSLCRFAWMIYFENKTFKKKMLQTLRIVKGWGKDDDICCFLFLCLDIWLLLFTDWLSNGFILLHRRWWCRSRRRSGSWQLDISSINWV